MSVEIQLSQVFLNVLKGINSISALFLYSGQMDLDLNSSCVVSVVGTMCI